MANRFPLIFNSGAGQIQELAASDNLDLTSSNLVNAGILFTSSGSATAPSMSIGSGTTYPPGLYSPGTDQVAVATNGTGRLFIDANGNVGLGTSSPVNFANYQTLSFNDTTGSFIDFKVNGTGTHGIVADSSQFLIKSISGLPVVFGTNDAERLRITSAGLVGIGNSSPATTLDVVGGYFTGGSNRTDNTTKSFGLLLPHTSNATSPVNIIGALTTTGQNLVYIGGSDSNLTGTSATTIHFYTAANATTANGTERLRLSSTGEFMFKGAGTTPGTDKAVYFSGSAPANSVVLDSSGRLGIGTSAPAQKLEIQDGSISIGSSSNVNATNVLVAGYGYILSSTKYGNTSIRSTYSNSNNSASLEFYVASGSTSTAEAMRIDSAGRVGIGSTTPQEKLEVNGNIANTIGCGGTFVLYDAVVNRNNRIQLGADASGAYINATYSIGGTGALRFQTVGIERGRFDESGRLLVGTSTARSSATQTWLSQIEAVSGINTPTVGLSIVRNQADIYSGYISFAKTRGTSNGATTIVTSGDELGGILFSGADGSTLNSVGASIVAAVDGTPGVADMPGRLVFSTTVDGGSSPTGRAMIDNRGVLHTFAAAGGDGHLFMTGENAGTTYYLFAGFRNVTAVSGASGTIVFQVFTNGNTQNTNNSYAGISDLKLKENIVDATSQWDDLKALQVRKYNFKEETGHQTHTQIGLIAQEVELVSPGLVNESPDRDEDGNDLGTVTKSVNYSVLYMKAVKALQEAMERIEALEADVAQLKGA